MLSMLPRRHRFPLRTGMLCALLVTVPSSGAAQNALRRGAPLQPVALVKRGDLLIGVGGAYEADVSFPLIAVRGDLARLGVVQLAYGVADGVVIELRGDLHRALSADSMGAPLVELRDGARDGRTSGAGDFFAGVTFRAFGGDQGFAAGGRLEFIIPSSNQSEGLGTNSIGVSMSVLGSYGRGRFHTTANICLIILEAPLENFEQNDVLGYAAELLYTPSATRPLRLYLGVHGRASTRNWVPVGTEDLGELRFGADYKLGRWRLDGGALVGYAGNSASWGVTGGLSFLLGEAGRSAHATDNKRARNGG